MRLQLKKEATAVDKADPNAVPIARAIDYLKQEAVKGKLNGHAARALLIAGARGYDIGPSLDDTIAFLKQPSTWGPDQHLPLASALASAERYGKAAPTDLAPVIKQLIAEQGADGSWPAESSTGTAGTIIATWSARATLLSSGMQPDTFTIVQADRWTRSLTPENVLEAAATILALDLSSDVMAENLRRTCLSILRTAQQEKTGGWGASATDQTQVFDTALAVLALHSLLAEPRLARSAFTADELKDTIAKGKQYLVSQQRPDGGWAEISISGWALLALLAN